MDGTNRPASRPGSLDAMQILDTHRNIGAKEAHSIGMTRRHPTLFIGFSHCNPRRCAAVLLAMLSAFLCNLSAHAQTAGGWEKRGQTAELKQDYDAAYKDWKAHQKNPGDLRYQERLDHALSGRRRACGPWPGTARGDIAGALNQFTRALQIDPGNEAAAQEIQITRSLDQTPGASNAPAGFSDTGSELRGREASPRRWY